jgi:hypothetical protein
VSVLPRLRERLRRASLWQRLALLLFPALLVVTGLELWMTRHNALAAANAAYDRSLLGALKSIDANISTASGGLSVELPYTMFEFFELTASGQVFFRVATSDGLVELGSADLPAPPTALAMGVPTFYDATYFGEAVRLAAYRRDPRPRTDRQHRAQRADPGGREHALAAGVQRALRAQRGPARRAGAGDAFVRHGDCAGGRRCGRCRGWRARCRRARPTT